MGATVLITLNSYDLPDVQHYDSMKDINWDTVNCLVFNSSKDSDFETIRVLSLIKDRVEKIIYINKEISPLFYCIFTGLEADIYDSEEYLSDGSVLGYLVDSYKSTDMTVKSSSSEIERLTKCISDLSNSDMERVQELLGNAYWLKTLNRAVLNVSSSVVRSDKANVQVVSMLEETMHLIKTLEQAQANTTIEIENLKVLVKETEKNERHTKHLLYSKYNVPLTTPKVMYIHAVGPCRYLNSFILSYQDYLKMKRQYTSKILFILPNLNAYRKRYNEAPRISMDSIDLLRIEEHDYFITFEPTKTVLDRFFTQKRVGLFIVVDLTFGDPLIAGSMVEKYYAASSAEDIARFNLDMKRTFLTYTGPADGPIIIPHIPKYASQAHSTRKSSYFDAVKTRFVKLDSVLIKDGR